MLWESHRYGFVESYYRMDDSLCESDTSLRRVRTGCITLGAVSWKVLNMAGNKPLLKRTRTALKQMMAFGEI